MAIQRIRELKEATTFKSDDYLILDSTDWPDSRKIKAFQFLSQIVSVTGVQSWNTRAGDVMPEAGDYTWQMVGINGAITTVADQNLPINRVIVSDADGKIIASNITIDQLNSLQNLSGNIQLELDNKLDKDGDGSAVYVDFVQADTRANIQSGQTLTEMFGLIAKWFADLDASGTSRWYREDWRKVELVVCSRKFANLESATLFSRNISTKRK